MDQFATGFYFVPPAGKVLVELAVAISVRDACSGTPAREPDVCIQAFLALFQNR